MRRRFSPRGIKSPPQRVGGLRHVLSDGNLRHVIKGEESWVRIVVDSFCCGLYAACDGQETPGGGMPVSGRAVERILVLTDVRSVGEKHGVILSVSTGIEVHIGYKDVFTSHKNADKAAVLYDNVVGRDIRMPVGILILSLTCFMSLSK